METESGEMKILVYREESSVFIQARRHAAEETTPAVTARPGRVHFSVQETEEKVFLAQAYRGDSQNPCRVIIGDRGENLTERGAKGIG